MSSLQGELDRLFQLPLGEFVSARNRLALHLAKKGHSEDAARVKSLEKPSVSAWAVNQLYWTARPVFDELIASGDRYREAQRKALSGEGTEGLGEAERDRRRAMEEALGRIREIVERSGHRASDPLVQRISTTLEALASYGSAKEAPVQGRLSTDVASPGFAPLMGLAPEGEPRLAGKTGARARLQAQLEEAERAVRAARAALSDASSRRRFAQAELESARGRLMRAEEQAAGTEAELAKAEARLAEQEARWELLQREIAAR